jgi:hypothetical protein
LTTALSDKTGPVGFLLEIQAGIDSIQAAQEAFANNTLLQQFFAYTQGLTKDDLAEVQKDALDSASLLDAVSAAVGILGDDVDGPGYRGFLAYLAQQVAGESGDGFWGRGEKITPDEAEFLRALKNRLGVA